MAYLCTVQKLYTHLKMFNGIFVWTVENNNHRFCFAHIPVFAPKVSSHGYDITMIYLTVKYIENYIPFLPQIYLIQDY